MTKSESIIKIAGALVKAQRNIGPAVKDAVNPFFKSKYADLGSIMEACKDALNEQGITVLQPISSDEHGSYVETILLHESGEFISDKIKITVSKPNDPQAQGSGLSYTRRYALQSMVFIPAEDDDANKAQVKDKETAKESVTTAGNEPQDYTCKVCGAVAIEKKGISTKGKPFHGIFCKQDKNHVEWFKAFPEKATSYQGEDIDVAYPLD